MFKWRWASTQGVLDHTLFLNNLYAGEVLKWSTTANDGRFAAKPYRAWISTDDGGDHIEWFATADEAKAAVLAKAKELAGDTD